MKGKASERLSSGYRINRAADDAAGLSISEKMRGQIRGLEMASCNIQDGISLIQTAEGGLSESHSVLHRMRELAVKAANETNTASDTHMIQEEIDALADEINRIAKQTEFNAGLHPLNSPISDLISNTTFTLQVPTNCTIDGVAYEQGEMASITCLFTDRTSITSGMFSYYVNYYSNENNVCGKASASGSFSPMSLVYQYSDTDADGVNDASNTYHSLSTSDVKADDENYLYIDLSPYGQTKKMYLILNPDLVGDVAEYEDSEFITSKDILIPAKNKTWIQTGASSRQGITINLVDATTRGLSLTNVDVTSNENASKAISTIDRAINTVSNYRSYFGAQQNRLEHAMFVADITGENLQNSEAKIRDANMSKEMVEYSKSSILEQAAQSILAHANQNNEGILNLFK